MSDPTPSEQRAANESLGDLISEVTEDMSTLLRQELALAKAELRESASQAAKAAGMLGGAGYAALMGVFFLSFALWAALAPEIGGGWAGLIVAAVWLALALALALIGRAQMKKVKGAPQTIETLQEILPTLSRNEENK